MVSLVERLRGIAPEDRPAMISCKDSTTREMNATVREAADTIEAQAAEIERLREAIQDAIGEIEVGAQFTAQDILRQALSLQIREG